MKLLWLTISLFCFQTSGLYGAPIQSNQTIDLDKNETWQILLEQNRKEDKSAIITARKLFQKLPENQIDPTHLGDYYFEIGLAYYLGNQLDTAHSMFENALKFAATNPNQLLNIKVFYQLAEIALQQRNNPALALYTDQLLELLRANENQKYLSRAYYFKASLFEFSGEYDSSLYYQNKSESIALNIHDYSFYYQCLIGKSTLYKALERYSDALLVLDSAKKYYHEIGNSNREADVKLNMATILNSLGQREEALRLYFEVLPVYSRKEKPGRYPVLLVNLGLTYERVGNTDKALEFYEKALENSEGRKDLEAGVHGIIGRLSIEKGNYEKAESYLKKGLFISLESKSKVREAELCYDLGNLFLARYELDMKNNLLDSSKKYYDLAFKKFSQLNRNSGLTKTIIGQAEVLKNELKYNEAERLLLKAEELAIKHDDHTMDMVAKRALSEINKITGDYQSAHQYLLEYSIGQDSLDQVDFHETLVDREYYYNYLIQVKQDSINNNHKLQMKDVLLAENERSIRIQSWVIVGATLALIIVSLLLYYVWKRNQQLFHARMLIDHQNIEVIRQRDEFKEALNALHFTQDKLIKTEKLAIVGSLTENMAHEINNPLHFIKGSSMAIRKLLSSQDPNKKEQMDQLLDNMQEGAERISHIVDGLSRMGDLPINLQTVDISAWLNQFIDSLPISIPENIKVEKKLSNSTFVSIYETGLEETLTHLFKNAIEAMPEGGTITITTQTKNDKTIIALSDEGIGMNPQTLQRAFEPFFSTKKEVKGVGLGLFSAYTRIKEMEGELTVTSEPNKGTTVEITFTTEVAG